MSALHPKATEERTLREVGLVLIASLRDRSKISTSAPALDLLGAEYEFGAGI
jgi:hypothetical protein